MADNARMETVLSTYATGRFCGGLLHPFRSKPSTSIWSLPLVHERAERCCWIAIPRIRDPILLGCNLQRPERHATFRWAWGVKERYALAKEGRSGGGAVTTALVPYSQDLRPACTENAERHPALPSPNPSTCRRLLRAISNDHGNRLTGSKFGQFLQMRFVQAKPGKIPIVCV